MRSAKTRANRSTLSRRSKCSTTRARPLFPTCFRSFAWSIKRARDLTSASRSDGGTSNPSTPSRISSGTPCDAGGHAGKFHGHGFRQRHGQALGKAGKAKHVGRRIKLADTILIDRAFKYDLCASFCRAARTARIGFVARVVLRQPGCGKPHRTFTITVSGGLNVFWRRTFRFG